MKPSAFVVNCRGVLPCIAVLSAIVCFSTSALAVEDGLGTNVVRNLRVTSGGTLSLGGTAITNWSQAPGSTNAILKEDDFENGGASGDLKFSYNDGVEIKDGAVDGAKIANGTITDVNIAPATVTGDKLAAGTISNANIAADAVTGDKIASGTVSNADIANDAVNNAKLAANAVTGDKIAAGTISNANIAADAVTGDKIASGTVSNADIANDAVNNAKLAANAVTGDKIADGTISNVDIAAGTVTGDKLVAGTISNINLAESITLSSLTVTNKQVLAPIAAQSVALGAEIAVSGPFVPIKGSGGAVSASIAAGSAAGQTLLLRGINSTDTVQITNNPPLVVLDGGINFTMGTNDVLQFVYSGEGWIEVHRADN